MDGERTLAGKQSSWTASYPLAYPARPNRPLFLLIELPEMRAQKRSYQVAVSPHLSIQIEVQVLIIKLARHVNNNEQDTAYDDARSPPTIPATRCNWFIIVSVVALA